MAKFNAAPLVVAGVVGVGAVAGWWLWRRSRARASGPPPTLEILTPPPDITSPSGTRIDFSARAMSSGLDISNLIHWRIIEPAFMAGEWDIGSTTFVIPTFLQTRILTLEASVLDSATGLTASAQRSVTVTVAVSLANADPRPLRDRREPIVLSVVNSFRRSDTGWRVKDRHILEEPWEFARR